MNSHIPVPLFISLEPPESIILEAQVFVTFHSSLMKNAPTVCWCWLELNFFIVVNMRLCLVNMGLYFGLMLETMLVTQCHYCRSVITESSSLFLLLTAPYQWAGWGCRSSWDAVQLGQLTLTDQRGILYHMMSCSAYKAGSRPARGWVGGERLLLICITCLPWALFLSLLFSHQYVPYCCKSWDTAGPQKAHQEWIFTCLSNL